MSDDEKKKKKTDRVVSPNTKTKDANYRKTQQTRSTGEDAQVKRKEKDKEKDQKKKKKKKTKKSSKRVSKIFTT